MTTPFELLYDLKPRTPSFPGSDIERLHYGESFAAERIQILQSAQKIAKQNIAKKTSEYKVQYDKNSEPLKLSVGDLVLFSETNFLGQNQKLSPKWLGPAEIMQLSDTNAALKLKNGKTKQLHLLRIKLFSMKKAQQEMNYDSDDEEFSESEDDATPNEVFNQLTKCAHTRAYASPSRMPHYHFHRGGPPL